MCRRFQRSRFVLQTLLVCLTADRFVCCDPQPEPAPQPAFAPAPAPDYSYDYGDDDDGPVADDV